VAGLLLGLVALAQMMTAEEVLASTFVVACAGVVVLLVQHRRRENLPRHAGIKRNDGEHPALVQLRMPGQIEHAGAIETQAARRVTAGRERSGRQQQHTGQDEMSETCAQRHHGTSKPFWKIRSACSCLHSPISEVLPSAAVAVALT